jgi:hypothetical protein
MTPSLRVIDGSKSGSFDGLILEVTGISGSSDSKRVAVNLIDSAVVTAAGDEWMFVVKSHRGGFGVVISAEKKMEWDLLVQEVNNVRKTLAAAI